MCILCFKIVAIWLVYEFYDVEMGKQITYHVFMDSKDIQKILGNSLKELREAKGLTQ